MSVKSISSFSCFATSFSFSLLSTRSSQVSLPKVLFGGKQNVVHHWRPVHPSILKPKRKLQKRRKMISLVAAEDVFFPDEEIGIDVSDPEDYSLDAEVVSLDNIQNEPCDENGGKPGFVSFYSLNKRESSDDTSRERENQNSLIWFAGPTILVASFILPSLYLRRIISTIFEDSLLTDFLILFFTEALFYCGVALFLLLIHFIQKPSSPLSSSYSDRNSTSLAGHRVSSVAILMLSLIIPMVTMGFVWPWTGPAASAALAPYLVGIVVQFAFEQYARYVKSPSWPVIPVVFQVYRLHQLNRAAQLVTALTFTVRGAEMTAHNLAINNSLGTLLNVLQLLGLICIWSLSSFLIRFSLLLTQRTR